MKKLVLPLMLASAALVAYASSDANPRPATHENTPATATPRTVTDGIYTVHVRVPGSMANELLNVIDQWTDVTELTVTGSPNSSDLQILSSLSNMRRLDLSHTSITSIGGCKDLKNLTTVVLPATVLTVEEEAFLGCSALTSINLPNVTTINRSGFDECKSLQTIDIPKVTTIAHHAFHGCSSLKHIDLSHVTALGVSAFYNCALQTVDLSSLSSFEQLVPQSAFGACSKLTTVKFGNMPYIPEGMFDSCRSLTKIELPASVSRIESKAFYSSSLKEIHLPSSINHIGYEAFSYCSPTDVYCSVVAPIATTTFADVRYVGKATLHVPAAGVNSYKLDENWFKFAKIVPLEEKISEVTIANSFTLYNYSGLADKINLTLDAAFFEDDFEYIYHTGHLTVNAEAALSVRNFTHRFFFYPFTDSWGEDFTASVTSTLIAENAINADNVEIHATVPTGRWNFISFPFDVNVSEIEMPEGALWVIRKYSGADRAASTGKTWQNMTAGTTLRAHEGYILHCTMPGDNVPKDLEMTVRACNNSTKNNLFVHDDTSIRLEQYPSEFAHNRSWNLVGNPYPSYYNISALDFTAPVTIWDGKKYVAQSPLDDTYFLRPYEAFFVQRPANDGMLRFGKEGRSHENAEASASSALKRAAQAPFSGRRVLNFILSGNGATDRTRLVLNEEATAEYELDRDASKFMSDTEDIPQIFVNDNGIRYAIDERPCGDGTFMLGTSFGTQGEYTISLDARNFAGKIIIEDTESGISADITDAPFTFVTEAGENPSRFRIRILEEGAGIGNVEADSDTDTEGTPYNLKGQPTSRNAEGIVIIGGKKILN